MNSSSNEIPEFIELETGPDPKGAVIWLHGLGADGHDFEPIVPELGVDRLEPLRFVFPHAPVRPVTINGGMAMRAWYDILTLDRGGPQDDAGIRDSGRLLEGLIDREHARGVAKNRIVLAGFSQGGAIILHTGVRYPERLGGLMALSTYIPLRDSLDAEVFGNDESQPRDVPIFMGHGQFDPVLPIELGASTRDLLVANGFSIEWHDYPMAHSVNAEEIQHVRQWLQGIYKPG